MDLRDSGAVMGKPVDRVDGRLKVTGAAKYSAEYAPPHLAYGFLVQSTIAKGRIRAIETHDAEAAPGVLKVLTHVNSPKMKATAVFDPSERPPKAACTSMPILNTDRIAWHGQPIAVVIAETFEQARFASTLVRATYDAQQASLTLEDGRSHARIPTKVNGEPPQIHIGDAEAALRKASFKIDEAYTTPRENHNPIEPHATIAAWEGDELTVYDASQNVYGVRQLIAEKFSIPQEKVRVLSPFVGGAFGGKGLCWPHVWLAVLAATVVSRPVKIVLTRRQMYDTTGYRTPTEQRVALAAEKDGKLTALIQTGVTTASTTNVFTEQFTFPARRLYASTNIKLVQKVAKLDVTPPTFMRAPGEAPGMFALESALDELSYMLGMDPVDLRLQNDPEKDPIQQTPFSNRLFKEALLLGAEKFGWAKRNPKPGSMRDGRYLVGMGMATAYYPVYQNEASARVRITADGRALVQSATHEMGMGTATAQTQNAADCLGLHTDLVKFEYGDTRLPKAPVSGGSSTTVSVGAAVRAACEAVKTTLLAQAQKGADSPLKGVSEDRVACANGGLFLKDDLSKGETYAAILKRNGEGAITAEATVKPADEKKTLSKGSYGAQFCELRIDPDFGTVRVHRFLGAFDVGRILNAKTARSQLIGGMTMGLGMALFEETHVDRRNGRVVNADLAEYLIPVHADVPALEAYYLDKPDPHTPMGAHGIGEIGITGVAAAVANAVYHATRKRIRDLPITPEKLM